MTVGPIARPSVLVFGEHRRRTRRLHPMPVNAAQRVGLRQEPHDLMEKLHAVFLQHDRVGAFADLDEPLVRDIRQLLEIGLCLIARQVRVPIRRGSTASAR